MGIYSAISTAVSGLRAQSFALEQISGNIANSQTTGFKRTESNFVDMIPDAPPSRQVSGGVLASARSTNEVQGDIQAADTETFIAVDGDGYFVVAEKTSEVDGTPVFNDTDMYTRRGDFKLDKHGYLVNGAGYYLQGLGVDPSTGNVSGSVPSPIEISSDFLDAESTTTIDYRANLPLYPRTQNADPDLTDSELLDDAVSVYTVDPTAAGAGVVQAQDESVFLSRSIAGEAITVYDSTGASTNIQFRWAKIANTPNNTWNLFYLEDSSATGTDTMWRNVGTDYVFGADGQLSPAVNSVTLDGGGGGLVVDGLSLSDITLQHGSGGLTQFADSNGTAQVTELNQDGYPAGELVSISISDSGRVTSFYSNGRSLELSEVVLASFNADDELRKADGGAFLATTESGVPILGGSGNILGSALEASNTDIADEFSKLIVTQQAYTANSRIITTSDEMLQEALNIVR